LKKLILTIIKKSAMGIKIKLLPLHSMANEINYCNSLTQYTRLKTVEVNIGNINFGGDNPIRLQSMTTTDTMDTELSIEQAIRMIDAGCE